MAWFTKGFLVTVVFAFVILVGSLYVWSNQAYLTSTMTEATQANQTISSMRQTETVPGIFLNNLEVSISMVIPTFGLIPFFVAWYNTGQIIGLLALATGLTPASYVLALVLLGFLEILGYTLFLGENLYITILAITRHDSWKRIKKESWKTFLLAIFILFLAAIVEVG